MNHDRYDDGYIRGILNTVPADLPVRKIGLTWMGNLPAHHRAVGFDRHPPREFTDASLNS